MSDSDMPNPRGPESAGVSAVLAVVLATIGFFALAVFGLGALSVATDSDIISTPGLGQLPGAGGMLVAVVVFALLLAVALRRQHPSFVSAAVIAVSTSLAHLVAVWIAAAGVTGSLLIGTAVAGGLVRNGTSIVLVVAAGVGAWGGIALRRTRSQRPRWPWERDEEE
ncbi:hypothetical protein [Microbacterium sp. 179-I 3D4 NHS]|uniref:hypothetical protein n=1 Tax=Microbacterium sp. 179-I 3D4 NHS TaxID=3142381 RepID=UPI0039A18F82